MANLLVVRHSYAQASSPTGDFDRQLTPEGIALAKKLGEKLASEKINYDLIIASAALRAVQTAEAILDTAKLTAIETSYQKRFYNCSPQDWLDCLQVQAANKNIMLIGHEPVLSALIYQLSQTNLNLRPCNAYLFTIDNWENIDKKVFTTKEYFLDNAE